METGAEQEHGQQGQQQQQQQHQSHAGHGHVYQSNHSNPYTTSHGNLGHPAFHPLSTATSSSPVGNDAGRSEGAAYTQGRSMPSYAWSVPALLTLLTLPLQPPPREGLQSHFPNAEQNHQGIVHIHFGLLQIQSHQTHLIQVLILILHTTISLRAFICLLVLQILRTLTSVYYPLPTTFSQIMLSKHLVRLSMIQP